MGQYVHQMTSSRYEELYRPCHSQVSNMCDCLVIGKVMAQLYCRACGMSTV